MGCANSCGVGGVGAGVQLLVLVLRAGQDRDTTSVFIYNICSSMHNHSLG
jgi:hypothetical protein